MSNEQKLLQVFNVLYNKIQNSDFVIDKSGVKTVEIMHATIEGLDPQEPFLDFGVKKTNQSYVAQELRWYMSQSRSIKGYVDDIAIWKTVANKQGIVNSNYGWCILSKENHSQFDNCLQALLKNQFTRQATMIYNRPSMHDDSIEDGMSDFMCTYYNQFLIRNNKLYSIYNMRSNDAVYGFFNDFAWACFIYNKVFDELMKVYSNLEIGEIIWQATSFHVYQRHFDLLTKICKEGVIQ